MEVLQNVPLATLTTLEVGGPARYFAEARNSEEVREAVSFARSHDAVLFVLGGGSNLVISDKGWPGLVLKVGILGVNHAHGHEKTVFEAGAGEDWDRFVGAVVTHNMGGIECLSGIPGSVGGTPVQNVGAYGQEVSETIESVTAIDLQSDEEVEIASEDCGFSYRTSRFNTVDRGRFIILKVSYSLRHGIPAHIEYADLKKHFAGWQEPPTLAQTRDAVRRIRASKSMLLSREDENGRSAGSFFKNPVLSEREFAELSRRAAEKSLQVPSYPALEGQRKVSAAWLVEHSGFSKGFICGHAGISTRHALALVNLGGASAADILKLKDNIQDRVKEIWGVKLQPEPVFVGF